MSETDEERTARLAAKEARRAENREAWASSPRNANSDVLWWTTEAERFNVRAFGGHTDWTPAWAEALSRARAAFTPAHSAPPTRIAGVRNPELEEAWLAYDVAYRKLWPLLGGPIDFEDLRGFLP